MPQNHGRRENKGRSGYGEKREYYNLFIKKKRSIFDRRKDDPCLPKSFTRRREPFGEVNNVSISTHKKNVPNLETFLKGQNQHVVFLTNTTCIQHR
jgi:hypothetical protein